MRLKDAVVSIFLWKSMTKFPDPSLPCNEIVVSLLWGARCTRSDIAHLLLALNGFLLATMTLHNSELLNVY